MKNNKTKILFTYLVAFSKTGGLEKVNRTILKCLSSINNQNINIEAWSLYDENIDSKYFPEAAFKGFGKSKIKYVFDMILNHRRWEKVLVGHINLAFVIRIIKFVNPKLKIILIVHGIEVWDKLKSNKLWLLENADRVISVSDFTKNIIINQSNIKEKNISVLSNCLDPYFPSNLIKNKPDYLNERYNIESNTTVILTITRINSKEGRKGYDKVIEVLHKIAELNSSINFKYILCGKYELNEYDRLMLKIQELNLTNKVILTGFIKEEELIDHYRLGDIYIMPSKKEGFGMVYIEAAACGLQVIAGNVDGSAEALLNGKIGHLVNPDSQGEIFKKLYSILEKPTNKSKEISDIVYKIFDFEMYKKKFIEIINEV